MVRFLSLSLYDIFYVRLDEIAHSINGGGKFGVMGALNDTMLQRGGKVIGVIHEMWMPKTGKSDELHKAITNLKIASGNNLSERKEMLKADADGFIVLPGGPGTYEEFLEIVSERQVSFPTSGINKNCILTFLHLSKPPQIGFHSKPLVVVDVDNFYGGIIKQFQVAHESDLLYREPTELFKVVHNAKDAVDFVMNASDNELPHVESHESSTFSPRQSRESESGRREFRFGFGAGALVSLILSLGIRSAL